MVCKNENVKKTTERLAGVLFDLRRFADRASGMSDVPADQLKDEVFKLLKKKGVDEITKKQASQGVARVFGLRLENGCTGSTRVGVNLQAGRQSRFDLASPIITAAVCQAGSASLMAGHPTHVASGAAQTDCFYCVLPDLVLTSRSSQLRPGGFAFVRHLPAHGLPWLLHGLLQRLLLCGTGRWCP